MSAIRLNNKRNIEKEKNMASALSWLNDIEHYIHEKSFGLAAIRVFDYNGATFGLIEPYGYYLVNYNKSIYLMRDASIAVKFSVQNETVVTAVVQTGQLTVGYIDALFVSPPASSSKLTKFILFKDDQPRKYSAITLINRCLDLRILTFED